ncbi:MAG: hypothetical protein U1F87_10240 [Kiritimatiellia bacterium]
MTLTLEFLMAVGNLAAGAAKGAVAIEKLLREFAEEISIKRKTM